MKVYANSLIGVGIASSLYHSSRGKLRKYLRWADYTMIATATVVSLLLFYPLYIHRYYSLQHYRSNNSYIVQCLSRALREENPKFLMAASALALPFQPLVVSAVHTGMMEVLRNLNFSLHVIKFQSIQSKLKYQLSLRLHLRKEP